MPRKNRNNVFYRKKKKFTFLEEVAALKSSLETVDVSVAKTFNEIPLSQKTQKGLKESGYVSPTEIQRETIGYSLKGEDILGAAQTGSGKTLAFLIPILEILYCKQWTDHDGLGALIITPTRELAYQIYETILKVGKFHDFSVALIIGGKDLHFEKKRMDQCNIIICTPGRILHHMDINPLFNYNNMQILVLDEADRCLDLGFQQAMNSIIENLPPNRQTLLFSATQTNSVKDLARLSLKHPKYVSVHEKKSHSTPDTLVQSYIVCEQHEKINLLWSFIKNHRRQKILIFLSSCKQVKYIFQLFCRLRPGSPLLALYGTLHQLRRMSIYKEFCSKQNVVMFATDIAARGLDFPAVDWVVQLDCPEDANTYIHRAGRTARYQKGGENLLVLLPSEEEAMIHELEQKKIPISCIQVNSTKMVSPIRKIEALLARDPNLKADAQRAFVAYMKSVFLMKNKSVFNVKSIDVEKFSASLGLIVTPRIRFLKREEKRNQNTKVEKDNLLDDVKSETESESDEISNDKDKINFEDNISDSDNCEDNDFLIVTRKNHEIDQPVEEVEERNVKKKAVTKAAVAKKMLKKKILPNKKIVFDEEGAVFLKKGKDFLSEKAREYEMENESGINIDKAREMLRAEDKFDKQLYRERVKAKHKEVKKKLKEQKEPEQEVVLGNSEESSAEESEPDTSWLPDPEKVFSKNDNTASNEDDQDIPDDDDEKNKLDENYSDSSDEEFLNSGENVNAESSEESDYREIHTAPKRKLKENSKYRKKVKLDDDFDTGLTLAETEEVALRILQSNRCK